MITNNIMLVGCGKMGGAILGGLLTNLESKSQILVISPDKCDFDVNQISDINDIPKNYKIETIIFAVKPQILQQILPKYQKICSNNQLIISIAAGKKVSFFEQHLGTIPIIRTMPNLPATISKAVTALYANSKITAAHKDTANKIFNAIGKILWLDSEDKMDAITAISGSGPAYVFYFLESLISAAMDLNLSKKDATDLVYQTVLGSVELACRSSHSAGILKEQVTSPNGTTAAGLQILEGDDNALLVLIKNTAKAAYDRSVELGE